MNIHIPFQTAYTQALELYGVELDLEEFESIGMIAWGKIGNKQNALYRLSVTPEKVNHHEWQIELPCNADILEAVTSDRRLEHTLLILQVITIHKWQ